MTDETGKNKLPISLVVITCNEEQNIERCLRAAAFCSELLVIDSGSKDATVSIAERSGAKVLHRDWTGYGDQKNFGTQQASQAWVLCIDADEVISSELAASIAGAFQQTPECEAYEINRHSYYAGKLIHHGGWYPQWRLFLYRKDKASWSGEEPHTTVVFHGTKRGRLRGDLYHYTYATIRQHLKKNAAAAYDWAVSARKKGRHCSWLDLLLRAPWSFFRTYFLLWGFLDGFYGLVIAVAAANYTFQKYAMLREMTAAK
jgi:glycosyltransferase involved in cell wall biosynthesis